MYRISEDDTTLLILCSFRYALGRSSYITHCISEIIKDSLKDLISMHLQIIYDEIKEYYREGGPESSDWDIDKERWIHLMHDIDDELLRRGVKL